jgi:CRISPR-associated endonuclease Cas2
MNYQFVLVCYDIPDTKVRNRLIHLLFESGLSRIQYSVFSGVLSATRIEQMKQQIRSGFPESVDKILVLELCRSCANHLTGIHMHVSTEPRTFIVV